MGVIIVGIHSWPLTTVTLSSFNFGLLILYGIKVLALSQLSSNNQDNQVAVLANFTVLIPVNNLQVHTYIVAWAGVHMLFFLDLVTHYW